MFITIVVLINPSLIVYFLILKLALALASSQQPCRPTGIWPEVAHPPHLEAHLPHLEAQPSPAAYSSPRIPSPAAYSSPRIPSLTTV